jgi:hypothetical protein
LSSTLFSYDGHEKYYIGRENIRVIQANHLFTAAKFPSKSDLDGQWIAVPDARFDPAKNVAGFLTERFLSERHCSATRQWLDGERGLKLDQVSLIFRVEVGVMSRKLPV